MPPSDVVSPQPVPALAWEDYRLLVESVVDYAIFMLDATGHIASWNLGAKKIKGYDAHEIIGQHFSKFYPPEDVADRKPERELEIASAHGRVEDEGWRVRKDGSRFWASVVITALWDEHGKLRGFGKVTRDLTDRRRAEEAERQLVREQTARVVAEHTEEQLRRSEARYRALSQRLEIVLEGVADGITAQDRNGRVVFANTAAARLCGFESAEKLMVTPADEATQAIEILDEDGRPFLPENLPGRRVLAGEPFGSAVLHIRDRRSGFERWASIRATAVPGADGKPELAINIWHDVSASREFERNAQYLAKATAALGASLDKDEMLKNLSRLLTPGLGDWCAIYLLDGDRLRGVAAAHANPEKDPAAQEYPQRFEPNRSVDGGAWQVLRTGRSVIHNEISEEFLARAAESEEKLERLRSIGLNAALLSPIRARNRVLGVLCLMSNYQHRYGPGELALIEEIGRRAGVAVENAQLYLDAQNAARAADEASRAKDEFLATVSHELRTPLSAVLGWSKILKDRVLDQAIARPIEVIHRNAEAQVKIIDDILDVSRVITGKFKLDATATDIVAITRDAIDVVRPSAVAKKIRIDFSPHTETCLLVADGERLRQVIWNLLSNAVKFTEPDGHVTVTVQQENATVLLRVADSGIGIDPAFLPFVFDRFRQADSSTTRRVSGLGLGLALVRHIVELHGGRVTVESLGLNQGATFTIRLPVRAVAQPASDRPAPAPAAAPTPHVGAALRGVRILIVDDEPDARELLSEVLTERGAVVELAGSATEGFESLLRFHPEILVSDIGMPGEDGFSLMRRIRALPESRGGTVPSLALTAFTRVEDSARAIAAGYTTHLGKPVNPDVLAAALANLVPLVRA